MEKDMQTELHATETLLQRGVKVRARAPLLFRLFGKRTIIITLSEPTGGAYTRMGYWYLLCGLPIEKLEKISVEDALLFNVQYGRHIYRALACLFIGNKQLTKVFREPVASWLEESLTHKEALSLLSLVILHGGLKDLMSITRLVRRKMITPPNLGQ